jgi:apolipoprotein N-acyltransferase
MPAADALGAPRLAGIAAWLGTRLGWRLTFAAALLGAASNLAMAPVFGWPVLWLTLPALVWLIGNGVAGTSRVARAALAGWAFGFGYFIIGLFWVGEAFLVEAEIFAWLIPIAVTLLPAGLALFWAAALACAALAPSYDHGPASRAVTVAVALSLAEWLRGHLFTGFPWNVLGYALTAPDVFMQTAALIGIYGLTFVALVVFILPPLVWAERRGLAGIAAAMATATLPLSAMWLYGALALQTPADVTPHTVRLVQPSVPQREKWLRANQSRIFEEHIALSRTRPDGRPDLLTGVSFVVWPEAAMPFLPLEEPVALAAIGEMLPERAVLLAGALRADPVEDGRRRIYNSLLAFDGEGRPVGRYDKIHLVPFGEYLPATSLLRAIGLQQLTHLRQGFGVGETPRPLMSIELPGGPVRITPLICYEAIFPRAIIQGRERPDIMLNVTNDGWFGNTTGPRQHFHQSRVRAVEEGIGLIRIANNGISAVIDPRGRVLTRLELNVKGVADSRLPKAEAPPLYARWGDSFFFMVIAIFVGILAGSRAFVWSVSKDP